MDLISAFIVLTLIGSIPFFGAALRLFSPIKSDAKYLDMPVDSLLRSLKQSAFDKLRTIPDSGSCKDVDFYEINYDSFREVFLFNKTPLREAVLTTRRDSDQITAVVRFTRDSIGAIGVHKYLVIAMANGDIYEMIAENKSQEEISIFRNEARVGHLIRKPVKSKGLSSLLESNVWDIFISGQFWGELKNSGRVITWSSYKIYNEKFPEGLPVKISEEEGSWLRNLRKCLLLLGLFLSLWTLWLYWFNKTSWSKAKWFENVNEDTVLLSNEHDLLSEETEMYFLVSIFLRLVIFGRDYRSFHG